MCCDASRRRGSIILLHDGGGDRSQTAKAIPMIIDQLRARGYEFVTVAQLLGKIGNRCHASAVGE